MKLEKVCKRKRHAYWCGYRTSKMFDQAFEKYRESGFVNAKASAEKIGNEMEIECAYSKTSNS